MPYPANAQIAVPCQHLEGDHTNSALPVLFACPPAHLDRQQRLEARISARKVASVLVAVRCTSSGVVVMLSVPPWRGTDVHAPAHHGTLLQGGMRAELCANAPVV